MMSNGCVSKCDNIYFKKEWSNRNNFTQQVRFTDYNSKGHALWQSS